MHREFEVADSVLQTPKLMGASTAEWKTALSRAKDKTAPGKRPSILTYISNAAIIKLRHYPK